MDQAIAALITFSLSMRAIEEQNMLLIGSESSLRAAIWVWPVRDGALASEAAFSLIALFSSAPGAKPIEPLISLEMLYNNSCSMRAAFSLNYFFD